MHLDRRIIRCISLGAVVAIAACGASNPVAPVSAVCASPAPIRNTRDPRAPDIFVSFKPGVDGSAAVARLQGLFPFTVLWEPSTQAGFLAALTDRQIASIRCDTAVAFLEWNSMGSVGARSPAP